MTATPRRKARREEESFATGRIRLIAFDEPSGVQRTPECLRLVCLMDTGGKLAIWGSDENRRNIDLVLKKGMPCAVGCEYIGPSEWGLVDGHSHWVPEHRSLRIVGEVNKPSVQ